MNRLVSGGINYPPDIISANSGKPDRDPLSVTAASTLHTNPLPLNLSI